MFDAVNEQSFFAKRKEKSDRATEFNNNIFPLRDSCILGGGRTKQSKPFHTQDNLSGYFHVSKLNLRVLLCL